MLDVIIVGGGPAGLSAALVLGRARRSVLICDAGNPRNAASHGMHCYLSRDGIEPSEFLRISREQLGLYEDVQVRDIEVTGVSREKRGFRVKLADGSTERCRRLLLATGVLDHIPEVEGLKELYGRSVHHCPYCDGWEWRDKPLAVYGRGKRGYGLAVELLQWSRDLVLVSDGPTGLRRAQRDRLDELGVPINATRILRLVGTDGMLERIAFEDGETLERSALFFNTGQRQCAPFAEELGCRFSSKGFVKTGHHEATDVPGVYVAGDASHSIQLVVIAAAEGAEAAFDINASLIKEEFGRG